MPLSGPRTDRGLTYFYGNVTNSAFSSGPTSLLDKTLTDTFFTNLTRVDIDTNAIDGIALVALGLLRRRVQPAPSA